MEAAAGLTWLASYPKSGSTWVRAFLRSVMEGGEPPDLDDLPNLSVHSRRTFDDLMGLSSADLDPSELDRLRPLYHVRLAAVAVAPAFAKTHDMFLTQTGGEAMFPTAAGTRAVYIVRNPLDVVPSLAAYLGCSPSFAIDFMQLADAHFEGGDAPHPTLQQYLGTWSAHVTSWLDQEEVTVLLVRYEDLLEDPETQFRRLIEFCGLGQYSPHLARAIESTRFDLLRELEHEYGFRECASWAIRFFRSGRSGGWRHVLTDEQVSDVVRAHGRVMERVGYDSSAAAPMQVQGNILAGRRS